MTALLDRVATPVERADFDDLVTLVTQAPPWEKDRAAGVRVLLRAIGEGKPAAPEQILARWTWARAGDAEGAGPPGLDRVPEAKRLLGAAANSRLPARGERQPPRPGGELDAGAVGAALLASADGYTPRANGALDRAREELGTIDRDRERARGQPPRAEADGAQEPPQAAEAEGQPQPGQPLLEAAGGGEAKPSADGPDLRRPAAAEDAA